jgi:hypothetical protein
VTRWDLVCIPPSSRKRTPGEPRFAPREARGDRQRPLRHVLGSDKCSLTSQFKGFQPALNEIEPDMLVAKGKIPRSSAWQW